MSRFDNSFLVLRAGTLWKEATTAAFLDAMSNGTLPPEALNRWLVQDHHFADALTSFQGIAAAKTPRQFRKLLIAGLGPLDAEMEWLEALASARGLTLNAPVHEVCRRYCDFLIQAASSKPYPVLLAVLFGVEASYLAAWSRLPPKGPYAEFIDRWSNPRFAEYVESLCVLTERATRTSQARAILIAFWPTKETSVCRYHCGTGQGGRRGGSDRNGEEIHNAGYRNQPRSGPRRWTCQSQCPGLTQATA